MKDHLLQIIKNVSKPSARLSQAREYLQARALRTLQDIGAFSDWAFLGGTALRFLYDIPRYSEDLDFSTVTGSVSGDFRKRLIKVKKAFENEAYEVEVKIRENKAVCSAFIKFQGLLFELGLSPHRSQVLSIKLDVDTNPPAHAHTETTLIRRYETIHLQHYDKASLLAGKLHALLARPHVKGRDLYDIVWYLADKSWPAPNFRFLNAALAQTNWEGPRIQSSNWKKVLAQKLKSIKWEQAVADVMPFLERDNEAYLLDRDGCLKLLLQGNAT